MTHYAVYKSNRCIGHVDESSEANARLAALSRFGVSQEEYAEGDETEQRNMRRWRILEDDEFTVMVRP